MLTQARLHQVLDYEPLTGVFRWKAPTSTCVRVGAVAGCILNCGYRTISVDRRLYLAYQLAWFYVHGVWPTGVLDHKDGRRDHDAIDNLRPATRAQNNMNGSLARNNKSGIRGVSFSKLVGKWQAHMGFEGKQLSLGFYENIEHAALKRACAEIIFYGEFASRQAFEIIRVPRP